VHLERIKPYFYSLFKSKILDFKLAETYCVTISPSGCGRFLDDLKLLGLVSQDLDTAAFYPMLKFETVMQLCEGSVKGMDDFSLEKLCNYLVQDVKYGSVPRNIEGVLRVLIKRLPKGFFTSLPDSQLDALSHLHNHIKDLKYNTLDPVLAELVKAGGLKNV